MPHTPDQKNRVAQLLANGVSKKAIARSEGIARSTIHDWLKIPEFVAEVERLKNAKAEVSREVFKQAPETVFQDLAQLSLQHFQAYRVLHEIALAIAEDLLSKIRANPAAIDSIRLRDLNLVASVLDRAIIGERIAAALEYEDLNKAIQALQKHGFLVVDSTISNSAKN